LLIGRGQLDKYNLLYLHVMDGLAFGSHGFGQMTLREFRALFRGLLIGNCGYTPVRPRRPPRAMVAPCLTPAQETAEDAVARGDADLIAFGRPFISNPDLPARIANKWPIAAPAPMSVFYSFDKEGYTTFPPYAEPKL
jgi:N-ethylmaleimide reductase